MAFAPVPVPPVHPPSPWFFRFAVFGGWVLFTLMVIAITWAGAVVRDRPFEPGMVIVWNLGWLLWAGTTFGVARLARRFPLERPRLARGVALHLGLSVAVAAATLCIEFAFNTGLQRLWPEALPPGALIGFFVYKFHIYVLIYWMVAGVTRAFDYYTRLRESEVLASTLAAQLAQAQLQTLQSQLHPHFLFNTHHSIISLMLKNDTPAAIKMLTRLSDLLRITLRQNDRQVTSLREELDALQLYLGIQKERYRERLHVRLDIEPDTLAAEVPSLLLQPIVENAFKHGFDTLSNEAELHLVARRQGQHLHLSVLDNGPGPGPAPRLTAGNGAEADTDAPRDLTAHTGLGLRNTQDRLARLYGGQQRLELRHGPHGGTCVEIVLPFQLPHDAEPSPAGPRASVATPVNPASAHV